MTHIITLRDDQADLEHRIESDLNHGARAVLGVLSTGGGKSVIMSHSVLNDARREMPQIVMAHRNELVSQLSMHVAKRGIPHRIIGSDQTIAMIRRQHRAALGQVFVNPSSPTAVVGVDTMIRRHTELKEYLAKIRRWRLDEGHHALLTNKWGKAIDMLPKSVTGAAYSATPKRADGMGLGRDFDGIYDTMQIGISMRSLIQIGALSDYEIVCPKSDLIVDDNEVSAGGDWSNQKLRTAAKKSHIVGDVVKTYCKYAWGRQAIVFATDVETAGEIAQSFNAAHIRAAALSAETNAAVREKYIEEFKTGKLQVLVNVDLFDEGFDVPACDVVIMARPTASLAKYRQMVGRALRFVAGKIALIIDHVGNVVRHGLPDKHIDWSLGRADKRGKQEKDPDDIPQIACENCERPFEKFKTFCPHCGAMKPLPQVRERTIEMVEGDLILLDREYLEQMRRATEIQSPAEAAAARGSHVSDMVHTAAINRQIEKIGAHDRLKHAIAQWAAVERIKEQTRLGARFDLQLCDREIQKKFYLTTGVDVLTALDGSRTRQQFDDMADRVERWYLNG